LSSAATGAFIVSRETLGILEGEGDWDEE